MENYIIIAAVLIIIGLVLLYIYKQKKKGRKCMGCPHCKECARAGNCDFEG